MSFGESLMRIRKAKGISRKDFAEQLQIPYTTLRNYETDQREPGHKLLISMATLLGVSVDELISHQVQNKKAPSLSDEAMKLARDYESLDNYGKRVVRLVVIEEKSRCEEQSRESSPVTIYAAASDGARYETTPDPGITLPESVKILPPQYKAGTDGIAPAPEEK